MQAPVDGPKHHQLVPELPPALHPPRDIHAARSGLPGPEMLGRNAQTRLRRGSNRIRGRTGAHRSVCQLRWHEVGPRTPSPDRQEDGSPGGPGAVPEPRWTGTRCGESFWGSSPQGLRDEVALGEGLCSAADYLRATSRHAARTHSVRRKTRANRPMLRSTIAENARPAAIPNSAAITASVMPFQASVSNTA